MLRVGSPAPIKRWLSQGVPRVTSGILSKQHYLGDGRTDLPLGLTSNLAAVSSPFLDLPRWPQGRKGQLRARSYLPVRLWTSWGLSSGEGAGPSLRNWAWRRGQLSLKLLQLGRRREVVVGRNTRGIWAGSNTSWFRTSPTPNPVSQGIASLTPSHSLLIPWVTDHQTFFLACSAKVYQLGVLQEALLSTAPRPDFCATSGGGFFIFTQQLQGGRSGSKTLQTLSGHEESVAGALCRHLSSPQPWPTEVVVYYSLIIKMLPSLISHCAGKIIKEAARALPSGNPGVYFLGGRLASCFPLLLGWGSLCVLSRSQTTGREGIWERAVLSPPPGRAGIFLHLQ